MSVPQTGDNIVLSMLGDAEGNGAGGFAVLDAQTFEVKGRWENGGETPRLNYDFWYQPRKNFLVSSEFEEPNAYEKGCASRALKLLVRDVEQRHARDSVRLVLHHGRHEEDLTVHAKEHRG